MLLLRWFLSRQVRHAFDACRQVRRLVHAQVDLVAPEAAERVRSAVVETRSALRNGTPKEIDAAIQKLDGAVQKNLTSYPHPRWRENIEVFLVTGAVVLALRTFFIQPMAIPSGSAQPTLYGIVHEDLRAKPDFRMPGPIRRFIDKWWSGISYFHIVAREDGELTAASEPRLIFPFIRMQTFQVGRERYRIYASSSFESVLKRGLGLDQYRSLPYGLRFRKGDDILKLKVAAGDHLFVNRLIYNFRHPRRGEIVVFNSDNIRGTIQNTHYIKRLVALGEERVRIGNDRHLIINGRRLDASTPGFENVYSFNPGQPPRDSRYSGHVNGVVASRNGQDGRYPTCANFPNETAEFVVRPKHFLAMGDNTMNSHDGRDWGDFPQERVIGRSSFVFWPITDRFGWGYR